MNSETLYPQSGRLCLLGKTTLVLGRERLAFHFPFFFPFLRGEKVGRRGSARKVGGFGGREVGLVGRMEIECVGLDWIVRVF